MVTDPALDVYLEVGARRTFACAVEWPGWCRGGPDETAALQSLLEYGPRYAAVVRGARLRFRAPREAGRFRIVQRLAGDATTDFGALGGIPECDRAELTLAESARLEKIIRAGWRALDRAREHATGKALRKGPRGGGRSLPAIVRHVADADIGHLGALGWKSRAAGLEPVRAAIIEALRAAACGKLPMTGPRGGKRWPVRFFVRRVAWHTIAHAWEIERRV